MTPEQQHAMLELVSTNDLADELLERAARDGVVSDVVDHRLTLHVHARCSFAARRISATDAFPIG